MAKKNGSFKMGVPLVHQLLKMQDMFGVIKDKRNMDRYTAGREGREAFLAWVMEEGGDIHFFKKQNFTPNKGETIPQGAFDLDPNGFTLKYLSKDFEYLGSEVKGYKKGGKEEFHKVKVKYELIKSLVDEYAAKDEAYIPKTGEVLSYTKFFSTFICRAYNVKKHSKIIEKEIVSIAKKNSYLQIKAMEDTALINCEREIEKEKSEIDVKKRDLEAKVSELTCLADYETYGLIGTSLDFKSKELATKLILKKSECRNYYVEVRKVKDALEIKNAAVMHERNSKRRAKRVEEKVSRMRLNNDLEDSDHTPNPAAGDNTVVSSTTDNSNLDFIPELVSSCNVENLTGVIDEEVSDYSGNQSVSSTGYEE